MIKRHKWLSRFSGLLVKAGALVIEYQTCILDKSIKVILCSWLSNHRERRNKRFSKNYLLTAAATLVGS